MTDTVEREEILDFVNYHMDGALLLVESGNPHEIDGIESTCGLSVGALSGSFQIEMLEDQGAECESAGDAPVDVRVYPNVPGGLTAVQSGQAAAFFAGVGAARYRAEVAPDEFDTAGPIYRASPFGAGFRKDDSELTEAIQAGLKQLVEDGTYIEVLDSYGMGLTALTSDQILINGAEQLNQEILEITDSP
jgi:polar amino acid transport system substrate-binding protein